MKRQDVADDEEEEKKKMKEEDNKTIHQQSIAHIEITGHNRHTHNTTHQTKHNVLNVSKLEPVGWK